MVSNLQLHQFLRTVSITTPIVILDLQNIPITKVRSKIEINLELYEYNVVSVGAALASFSNNMPCIYIIIDK